MVAVGVRVAVAGKREGAGVAGMEGLPAGLLAEAAAEAVAGAGGEAVDKAGKEAVARMVGVEVGARVTAGIAVALGVDPSTGVGAPRSA